MDTHTVEYCMTVEERDRVRGRAFRYSIGGALASAALAFGVFGGGTLFTFSHTPKAPLLYATYDAATKTLTVMESELSATTETLPYKNPAVEKLLKGRAPIDDLETAIGSVKSDISRLKEDPSLTAYLEAKSDEVNYVFGSGVLALGTMLLGFYISERAKRRIENGLPPFVGS